MVGVGLIGFLSKLHKWDESAMFFDGSSLGAFLFKFLRAPFKYPPTSAAYVFSIVVYLTVTINSLRTIVTPIHDVDTREDQVMAMRVLSAGNVIIIVALVLILALQVTPFSRPSAQLNFNPSIFAGRARVGTPHGGESHCRMGRGATKKGNNHRRRKEGPVIDH